MAGALNTPPGPLWVSRKDSVVSFLYLNLSMDIPTGASGAAGSSRRLFYRRFSSVEVGYAPLTGISLLLRTPAIKRVVSRARSGSSLDLASRRTRATSAAHTWLPATPCSGKVERTTRTRISEDASRTDHDSSSFHFIPCRLSGMVPRPHPFRPSPSCPIPSPNESLLLACTSFLKRERQRGLFRPSRGHSYTSLTARSTVKSLSSLARLRAIGSLTIRSAAPAFFSACSSSSDGSVPVASSGLPSTACDCASTSSHFCPHLCPASSTVCVTSLTFSFHVPLSRCSLSTSILRSGSRLSYSRPSPALRCTSLPFSSAPSYVKALATSHQLHEAVTSGLLPSASSVEETLQALKDAKRTGVSTYADYCLYSEALYQFFMSLNLLLPIRSALPPSLSFIPALLESCKALLAPFTLDGKTHTSSSLPSDLEENSTLSSFSPGSLSGPAVTSVFLFLSVLQVAPLSAQSALDLASNRVDTLARLGLTLSLKEHELDRSHLALIRVALEMLGVQGGSDGQLLRRMRDSSIHGQAAADFFGLVALHPAVVFEGEFKNKGDQRDGKAEGRGAEGQQKNTGELEREDGEEKEADEDVEEGDEEPLDDSERERTQRREENFSPLLSPLEREVSSILFRLERPHETSPARLGPFVYTLRNAKTKELFVCQQEAHYFSNAPELLCAREQWRYRLAELRGWRVVIAAREREWSGLPSDAEKEAVLRRTLSAQAAGKDQKRHKVNRDRLSSHESHGL
ncbi:hypothetical protein CSUI_001281 [Cystoisospora suis]|uniref:RAP domain-containing protein n=1 Tax=Cystoisospora suis TaxID=483139 RepID=A0A2C6LDM1_9APIC|nr:hypothetical protein CSUI_001281 [Cystoisospora suis]